MDDKGGKRGYLGIVAHYVDSSGELRDLPIALPQLTGAYTGEAMAEVVMAIFKQFEITVGKLGYFVLDNAHNNNTTINTLALQIGFSATERRLRCGPYTLNLIGQMLLWGEEKESYDNEETERVNEAENMATWRGDGPLGVLVAVINYIKTPQQPLKQATKRLEGRGKSGAFGAIAEVILVFEYLLGVYEDRLQSYEDVIYDEHTESPEDHLAINLRAALVKAREYYNKLDLSPAYYAAIILHPRYKATLTQQSSNRKFQHLWAEYKAYRSRAYALNEPIASEGVDPIKYWVGLRDRYPSLSKFAIDMLSIPGSSCECERLFSELGDLLEPRRRQRCQQASQAGLILIDCRSQTILWDVPLQLDLLVDISGRRSISPQLLAAIQCDRRWIRARFGSGEVPVKEAISDEEMDAKYGVHKWDIS
ncbi:Dimer-Tnp-hAT domain containing protein [Pyrenophora tritici-repentis]|nr:Dimer-Tnp-hAT domain containing protein [Pyrenophora tritici-repentis]